MREKVESGYLENLRLVAGRDFLKEALAEKERDIKSRDQEINELKREASRLKSEADDLRARVDRLNEEFKKESREKEDLRSELKGKEDQLGSMDSELAQLKKIGNRLTGEVQRLRLLPCQAKGSRRAKCFF